MKPAFIGWGGGEVKVYRTQWIPLVFIIIYSLLTDCAFGLPRKKNVAIPKPADSLSAFSAEALPLSYSVTPGPLFDPHLKTIFYDPGGPIPLALSLHKKPWAFPLKDQNGDPIQLVRLDYLGTARRINTMGRNLTDEESASLFTAERHAMAVLNLIKVLEPQHYIFYGVSHGVQMFLRVLDKINREPSLKIKPKAVIFDSGVGRTVNKDDLKFVQTKKNKGLCAGGRSKNSLFDANQFIESLITIEELQIFGTVEENYEFQKYLELCELKSSSHPFRQQHLFYTIRRFSKWTDQGANAYVVSPLTSGLWTAENIKAFAGCPPIDNIHYHFWTMGMACGAFDADAAIELGLIGPPLSYCPDRALDLAAYEIGSTSVLGFQSSDDCTNFEGAMDYLMEHIQTPEKAYFKVLRGGGHGKLLKQGSGFEQCLLPDVSSEIISKVFEGEVKKATALLQGCYKEGPLQIEKTEEIMQWRL